MSEEIPPCRQCGGPKTDNGFVICGGCMEKNAKYERQINKMRLNSRGYAGYHREKDSGLISKEYVGRKSRAIDVYVHDEKPDERNVRTEYHGDNYSDE